MIAFLQQAILAIIVAGVIAVGAFIAVIWYRRRRAAQAASTQTVA
jgi:membrane protein DedA with SNARE-associated domain